VRVKKFKSARVSSSCGGTTITLRSLHCVAWCAQIAGRATPVGMTGVFVGRQDAGVEILRFAQDDKLCFVFSSRSRVALTNKEGQKTRHYNIEAKPKGAGMKASATTATARAGRDAGATTESPATRSSSRNWRGKGFVYDFAVEEMDGAFGVIGVAGVVGNHADGGAAGVNVLEKIHDGVAIF
jgi:hypothetical protein